MTGATYFEMKCPRCRAYWLAMAVIEGECASLPEREGACHFCGYVLTVGDEFTVVTPEWEMTYKIPDYAALARMGRPAPAVMR